MLLLLNGLASRTNIYMKRSCLMGLLNAGQAGRYAAAGNGLGLVLRLRGSSFCVFYRQDWPCGCKEEAAWCMV